MAAAVIQFKRGTYAGLPALNAGEPGFSTDKYDFYVGLDGTSNGNKFLGASRYWTREDGIDSLRLNLVDRDGINRIALRAPNTLSGVTTYVFPETPVDGGTLVTNASGTLSWSSSLTQTTLSALYVTGLSTFQSAVNVTDTTNSSDKDTGAIKTEGGLGVELSANIGSNLKVGGIGTFVGPLSIDDTTASSSSQTGALIVDGGAGIARDLYVGAGLSVTGITTFASNQQTNSIGTGAVDIKGGLSVGQNAYIGAGLSVTGASTLEGATTINGNVNLGNAETDVITINADISGDILPETDNTFNLGDQSAGKTFLNASLSGIVTATNGGDFGTVQVAVTSERTIYSDNGPLILDAQNNEVIVDADQKVKGSQTVTGNQTVDGSATIKEVQIGVVDNTTINTSAGNLKLDASSNTIDITAQQNVTGMSTFTNGITATHGPGKGIVAGNIGIATVDANTISTNSGDLYLRAATGSDVVRVTSDLIVTGQINGTISGSISTAQRSSSIDVSSVSDSNDRYLSFVNASAGDLSATGLGQTMFVDPQLKYNANSDTLSVPTIQAGAVKAADGSDAITLADTTGNVSFASSVTVTGDITVLGSQFIVNTEALKVEDPIIELGLVNSGGNLVAPSSDSNLDVGMIMHYYTGSTAKTAAVYWDDSVQRVAAASSVTESSNVMTEIVYANFEVGGLWVNDDAGQSQVIGHDGSNRVLQNITVDGGSF
tara:strand:+ start:21309 stop:23459 length:2151 start_codon:yes stop_codon:yes gene_type:complete